MERQQTSPLEELGVKIPSNAVGAEAELERRPLCKGLQLESTSESVIPTKGGRFG